MGITRLVFYGIFRGTLIQVWKFRKLLLTLQLCKRFLDQSVFEFMLLIININLLRHIVLFIEQLNTTQAYD